MALSALVARAAIIKRQSRSAVGTTHCCDKSEAAWGGGLRKVGLFEEGRPGGGGKHLVCWPWHGGWDAWGRERMLTVGRGAMSEIKLADCLLLSMLRTGSFVFLLLLPSTLPFVIRVFQVLSELFLWLPYERPGSGDWPVFLNSPDSSCRLNVLSRDLLRAPSAWP